VKTIVVELDVADRDDGRLDCAADLARAFGGHIIGLQVTPLSDLIGGDAFGGVFVLPAVLDAVAERETAIRRAFEARMARAAISWEFRHEDGPPAAVVARHSRLADVVVVAQPGERSAGLSHLGELVLSSSAPLLVTPRGLRAFNPAGKAIVAWNGSPEASAAVRAALAMLKRAGEVTILAAEEPDAPWDIPPTGLAEFLSRHDIHASTERVSATSANLPHTILREISDRQPDYLVMGAYGRSRASEWLLGGVTRRMLSELPVPILMSH
jgi:nucleotide-binding universal stress UspA family protein